MTEMKEPPRQHSKAWTRLAPVALSLIALSIVFSKIDLPSLALVLRNLKPAWLAAAALSFITATLFAAARWHAVLRLAQSAVHAGATLRVVFIGHFFNTVLFGPAGGDFAKAALYARWFQFPIAGILSTCFLDRILGGGGFLLYTTLMPGLALAQETESRFDQFLGSPQMLLLAAVLSLALILAALFRYRIQQIAVIQKLAAAFQTNAAELLKNPRVAFHGLFLSFFAHCFMSGVFLCCLHAVSSRPFSWTDVLWTFPVISAISSVPVTFAGIGVREGAALTILGLYGIPATDAVAASLLLVSTYFFWAACSASYLWMLERRRNRSSPPSPPAAISVVIPTLNEAAALPETLRRVRAIPEVSQVIVADGGSADDTAKLAQTLGCQVITGARGRGPQMRAGAAAASGDVVLLLHADTWLPPHAGRAIFNCLRDPRVVGGGFWKRFRKRSPLMAGSRFRCALRLILWKRILGDQCLFIRRSVLEKIGGVPSLPLMEEFALCEKLRAEGRLALASATVTTSDRRFAKFGVCRTYLRMASITLRYYLGTSPQKLAKLYEKEIP